MNNPKHSEILLRTILEAAQDAIVIANEHGEIVDVNPAASEMFQRQKEDLIGQSVNILAPDAMPALNDNLIQQQIETGEMQIIGSGRDMEGQRKDGSVFPLHLSVGSTHIEDKRMFIAILHDLTQRTAALQALSRSQRMDAVGQMTGGIAHDFNNLLTIIIGNLELTQMHGLDASTASLIKDALDAAEMGADLTARLLVFARKSNLKPVEADLRVLCKDALAILDRTLGSQMRITTEFAPQVRRVLIDPVQFQSALVNLVLNARDAMDDIGELCIAVNDITVDDNYLAQEIDVEPGEYVRLAVSDNGAGMDEEAQRQAFEPFFTTKKESGGSGLGLAMVYGFVRQSGGHITLYSEPGFGTSFGLYFPAVLNSAEEKETESTRQKVGGSPDIGKGRTVLVVDDNPKVRSLSLTRIAQLGFQTVEASSGDEAFALLKDGLSVDILFSDLVMPGNLNGYDLAAKVEEEFPKVKVLLTSGYASDVVSNRADSEKRYDVLHKPFRQSDLLSRLQSLLEDE